MVKGAERTAAVLCLKPKDDKKSFPSECDKLSFVLVNWKDALQILHGIQYHAFIVLTYTSYKTPIITYFRKLHFRFFVTVNDSEFGNLLIK